MSADITAGPATGATSSAFPRHEQTFPTLTPSRNRAHAPVRRAAKLQGRRSPVRDRQGRPRHVRGAVGPCRDHPARRPRPCHAHHRPGPGTISRRDRPAFRPRRAGRRPCRGRRRNAADSAGPIARASGRGSRTRRAHHARADPAPGQPDPGRRRRPGADRPALARRHGAVAEFPGAQRPAAPRARSRDRQGRRRSRRALLALARRSAAGGVPRRHRAAQSVGDGAGAGGGHDHQPCA